jgi:hypothetical protein
MAIPSGSPALFSPCVRESFLAALFQKEWVSYIKPSVNAASVSLEAGF